MAASYDVVVAGLGAMGSAAAFHLARRGARVIGFDRFSPPHALGSSHGRTRIIREAYFEHPLYVPLVQRAYELWAELERACGRELLQITGGLMIGPPDGVLVSGARRSAEQHRLEHEFLSADAVLARFPALRPEANMVAVWEPRAGVLFPEACIEAHLSQARHHGATLNDHEPVLGWRDDAGGVTVITERSEYRTRQLVLTAGGWVRSLVPAMAAVLEIERQVLYWFAPRGDPSSFAPEHCPVHLWEFAPREFFYGFPDFGQGVKVALHHGGECTDPDRLRREVDAAETAAIRELVQRFVPDANGALRSSAVCFYTNTPDEHFWIDRHPEHANLRIASPCSGHGFKFSSVIGEVIADLVLAGASRFDLGLFRRR